MKWSHLITEWFKKNVVNGSMSNLFYLTIIIVASFAWQQQCGQAFSILPKYQWTNKNSEAKLIKGISINRIMLLFPIRSNLQYLSSNFCFLCYIDCTKGDYWHNSKKNRAPRNIRPLLTAFQGFFVQHYWSFWFTTEVLAVPTAIISKLPHGEASNGHAIRGRARGSAQYCPRII